MSIKSKEASEDDEQTTAGRFAYLLKPIRDLAQNWNIDIATELEEYLNELEEIVINFDGEEAGGLNFAEAALLIQGSACVYSKKVEYLYGLLFKTLDAVVKKKDARDKKLSSVDAQGQDLDALFESEAQLLPLDDVLTGCEQIDLPNDSAPNMHISRHGPSAATRQYTQQRASTLMARLPTTLLSREDGVGGQGDDTKVAFSLDSSFALSNCIIHESGTLLVEAREADCVLSDTAGQGVTWARNKSTLEFGSPASLLHDMQKGQVSVLQSSRQQSLLAPISDTTSMDDNEDGEIDFQPLPENHADDNYDNDDPGLEIAMPLVDDDGDLLDVKHQDDSTSYALRSRSVSAAALEPIGEEDAELQGQDEAETADPYELLDPHDAHPRGLGKLKEYKKGKTYKKPKALSPLESQQACSEEYLELLTHSQLHPLFQKVRKAMDKGSIKVPYFPEFIELYLEEAERRQTEKRARRKAAITDSAVRIPIATPVRGQSTATALDDNGRDEDADDDALALELDLDGPSMDNLDEGAAALWGVDQERPVEETVELLQDYKQQQLAQSLLADEDLPAEVDFLAAAASAAASSSSSEFSPLRSKMSDPAESTYDELCRQHVNAYMKAAEAYLTESSLTKRVSTWQERIVPLLEEEEKRAAFDINIVGDEILCTMIKLKAEHRPHDGEEDPDRIDFADVFRGKSTKDANDRNVEIVTPQEVRPFTSDDGERLSLRLLSADRERNMQEYKAPSMRPKSAQTTQEDSSAEIKHVPTIEKTNRSTKKADAKEQVQEGPKTKHRKRVARRGTASDEKRLAADQESEGKLEPAQASANSEDQENDEPVTAAAATAALAVAEPEKGQAKSKPQLPGRRRTRARTKAAAMFEKEYADISPAKSPQSKKQRRRRKSVHFAAEVQVSTFEREDDE